MDTDAVGSDCCHAVNQSRWQVFPLEFSTAHPSRFRAFGSEDADSIHASAQSPLLVACKAIPIESQSQLPVQIAKSRATVSTLSKDEETVALAWQVARDWAHDPVDTACAGSPAFTTRNSFLLTLKTQDTHATPPAPTPQRQHCRD
ncbi:hypothetical protein PINS_up002201 [Pythium insidiosum]|nr:hypothetical protein PINS_up002201 [Pythium insidiosum]